MRSSISMFIDKATPADTMTEVLSASRYSTVTGQFDVSFDAENEVLVVNWEGQPNSDEVRRGYDVIMSEVCLRKPKKLLLDLHKRGKISRKDQRWVFSTVFPKVLRVLEDNVFVAVVLPVHLYSGFVVEMDGDELMHDNNFLIIHHALYREEAYRWLNTMHLQA